MRLSRRLGRLLPFLILEFAGGEHTLSGESRCAPYSRSCAIPAHLTDNNVAYLTIPSASSRDAHLVVFQRNEYIDPLMPFDDLFRDRITVARIAFGGPL